MLRTLEAEHGVRVAGSSGPRYSCREVTVGRPPEPPWRLEFTSTTISSRSPGPIACSARFTARR
ncbi:MAG: hypothetical protein HY815_02670 [Candidatus Riflebacteria bacterium]|nr:hypothetical protein [Candidatus Riflebacteria bacterium]